MTQAYLPRLAEAITPRSRPARRRPIVLAVAGLTALALVLSGRPTAAGEVVISVEGHLGFHPTGLYRVNTTTGAHALLSDFENPAQGPVATHPREMAQEPSGHLLVVTNEHVGGLGNQVAIFRVNPATGARTILCDVADPASGYVFSSIGDVAVGPSGRIYVVGSDFGVGQVVAQVNPITGHRTVVSDLQDATQGPVGSGFTHLAVEASGDLLLLLPGVLSDDVVRIDPITGQRTVVTSIYDPSENMSHRDLAVESSGAVLVLSYRTGSPAPLVLVPPKITRVDPASAAHALVSDYADPAQGPTYGAGNSVGFSDWLTVELSQRIVALSRWEVLRVHPVTGAREVVTPFWATQPNGLNAGTFWGLAALGPPCLMGPGALHPGCVRNVFEIEIGPWLVGCESVDCCPFCPLDSVVDWVIQVESVVPGDLAVVDVVRGNQSGPPRALTLQGDGVWLRDGRLLVQPGRTLLRTPMRLARQLALRIDQLGWWHGGGGLAERMLRVSVEAFLGRRLIHAQQFRFEAPATGR